jgi:hypothetical protein
MIVQRSYCGRAAATAFAVCGVWDQRKGEGFYRGTGESKSAQNLGRWHRSPSGMGVSGRAVPPNTTILDYTLAVRRRLWHFAGSSGRAIVGGVQDDRFAESIDCIVAAGFREAASGPGGAPRCRRSTGTSFHGAIKMKRAWCMAGAALLIAALSVARPWNSVVAGALEPDAPEPSPAMPELDVAAGFTVERVYAVPPGHARLVGGDGVR